MKLFRTAIAVMAIVASGCARSTMSAALGTYGVVSVLGTEEIAFSGGLSQTTPTIVAESAIVATGVLAILAALHLNDWQLGGGGGGGGGESSATSSSAPNAASPSAGPAGHAVYDRNGAFGGHSDAQGNTYDANGAFAGHTDTQGNTYDKNGAFAGHSDAQGNTYDSNGAYAGRVDPSGGIYDKNGANDGRIDSSGNIYDKNGALAGHVDGSCDDACKRATAARVLHP